MADSSTRKPKMWYSSYMDSLISCAQAQNLDKLSQKHVPAIVLMEQAACRMSQAVERGGRVKKDDAILFLVGPGNNGGDALAFARSLACCGYSGLQVLCMEPRSELCRIQSETIADFPIRRISHDKAGTAIDSAQVIVDGLFGVGLSRPVDGAAKEWIARANANSRAWKIAIDLPSGIGDQVPVSSISFHADVTYTMGLAKSCMFHPATCASCGREIVVLNPSFPPRFIEACPSVGSWESIVSAVEPPLRLDAFKNSRGSVAIFAGSRQYSGAARLSSQAAFHAGSGLVTLFADRDSFPVAVTSAGLSVMVRHEEEAFDLSRFDAILAGPGWGTGREALLRRILESEKPVVVDADGLVALANLVRDGYRPHGPLVLTPHVGELSRLSSALLGRDIVHDTPQALLTGISQLATQLGAVVVLKSAVNQIVKGGRMAFLDCKNPAIAVAGSGDVLAGIILCLLGQKLEPFEAALQGCRLHQWKGKLLGAGGYFTSQELEECL